MSDPASKTTGWRALDSVPTDGEPFLAELSNGWVVILHANGGVRRGSRYSWWSGQTGSVPYEPSHPADTDWSDTLRLTGWQPLPKSRQQIACETEAAESHG